jgi:2-C-methyl-D-erythritol 4-phosphate cytidylyltransferase
MQSTIPKQFMELAGKPILCHTLETFKRTIPDIELILVLPKDQVQRWVALQEKHDFKIPHKIVQGGNTRFESVQNGLKAIEGEGLVAVHDAVRPLVNPRTILSVFKEAEMYDNAVPAIPMTDSIRMITTAKSIAVDRTKYCIIQTPQCFLVSLLKRAYEQNYQFNFTDDATVVEGLGIPIRLIDGKNDNIKITTPGDLIIAEALIKSR